MNGLNNLSAIPSDFLKACYHFVIARQYISSLIFLIKIEHV